MHQWRQRTDFIAPGRMWMVLSCVCCHCMYGNGVELCVVHCRRWLCVCQGSKNLFCASRRIFRAEPGRHFSGRIFFQLGRNHAPRLTSLGAKKEAIFEASFCTHQNTKIIDEIIASSFFFKIDWKQKKIEKKLLESSCAQFILLKPGEEGVGVVE